MTDEERTRLDDTAAQLALMALLRFVIGEVFMHSDRAVFRRRLSIIEGAVIDGLTAQNFWPGLPDDAATYAREAASGWVSRALAGIQHPDDADGT